MVLDLHAGGQGGAVHAHCASFHTKSPTRREHAPHGGRPRADFGTPFVITYQNATVGLLTSEPPRRLGKVAVGCELGWGGAVQPAGVRFARRGVLAAAIRHGQVDGPAPSPPDPAQLRAAIVDRACFVPAPFGGHYEPVIECGDRVSAGDVVGLLHDFERLDLAPHPIRGAVDGLLVAQAWRAPVRQGQHVVVVGRLGSFAGA